MLLSLMDDPNRIAVQGKVVWITPEGVQGNRTQGIGVQFTLDETGAPRRRRSRRSWARPRLDAADAYDVARRDAGVRARGSTGAAARRRPSAPRRYRCLHVRRFALPSRFSRASRRPARGARGDARATASPTRCASPSRCRTGPRCTRSRARMPNLYASVGVHPDYAGHAEPTRDVLVARSPRPEDRRDRRDRARLFPAHRRPRMAARALSHAHPRRARLRQAARDSHARRRRRHARDHARRARGRGGRRHALLHRDLGRRAARARPRIPHLVLRHRDVQERRRVEGCRAARAARPDADRDRQSRISRRCRIAASATSRRSCGTSRKRSRGCATCRSRPLPSATSQNFFRLFGTSHVCAELDMRIAAPAGGRPAPLAAALHRARRRVLDDSSSPWRTTARTKCAACSRGAWIRTPSTERRADARASRRATAARARSMRCSRPRRPTSISAESARRHGDDGRGAQRQSRAGAAAARGRRNDRPTRLDAVDLCGDRAAMSRRALPAEAGCATSTPRRRTGRPR